jgi:hypothetical protein
MTVYTVVPGTFLVDGRVAGIWSLAEAAGTATLTVEPYVPLAAGDRAEVEEEGLRLARFLAGKADDHDVRLV